MSELPIYTGEIPYLTTAQMVEVDRAMIEDFKIDLIQMMENAGRNLANLARQRFFDGSPEGKRVVVLVGTGGNGGGALVCARHLHNYGSKVSVFVTRSDESVSPVPKHQLDILRRMNVPVDQAAQISSITSPDLIVDGIIGYSLQGAPRGPARDLILWANSQDTPILALDAPSGLDTSTGTIYDPAIKATATMTLALPKDGLQGPRSEEQVGELYLADISVPPSLYGQPPLGLVVENIFAKSDIVRLH